MKGFLLGLSSGAVCLTYCVPVLIPYILGQGKTTKKNYLYLGSFLAGRLIGYILFAFFAYIAGRLLLNIALYDQILLGLTYVLLALMLFSYGAFSAGSGCAMKTFKGLLQRFIANDKWTVPVVLGLLTGINLCPPFLLAFTEAANAANLLGSLDYFCAFFIGTAVYFLPLPFLGVFHRNNTLRLIGKMAAVVVAIFYLYKGIIMLAGGIMVL